MISWIAKTHFSETNEFYINNVYIDLVIEIEKGMLQWFDRSRNKGIYRANVCVSLEKVIHDEHLPTKLFYSEENCLPVIWETLITNKHACRNWWIWTEQIYLRMNYLVKRLELLGIRGIQLHFFQSYLTNTTQIVKISP